jgi:dCMP deaminase
MSNETHVHSESCGHQISSAPQANPLKHRPRFEEIYMRFAFELAKRSTCLRLSVGCVITSVDYSRVFGIGYNGNARGLSNSCESTEPGNCGCLHAEDNALLKTSEGPEVPKIVFVTHQPCAYCAKRMVNKGGIRKVYFSEPYRLRRGLEVLEQVGIVVEQLKIPSI